MYHVYPTEHPDGRKSDVIYLPNTKQASSVAPPVIVEIQTVVDPAFMRRTIRYCLNVHDKHKVAPIVVAVAIRGFSSKGYKEANFTREGDYYTTSTAHWAHEFVLYTLDSIANNVPEHTGTPMEPITALIYFLCSQQRSIMSLEEYKDTNLQKMYTLAYTIFRSYYEEEEDKTNAIIDICDKAQLQFQKILQCSQEDTVEAKRKLARYAENGMAFVEKRRKMMTDCNKEEAVVTPIENTESADFHFVKRYKEKHVGRTNWKHCYSEGLNEKLFSRFGSHLSLKNAYNANRL